jgi:hypothetical protein
VESAFTYSWQDVATAQEWAGGQMRAWGIAGPHVGRWLQRGAELLGESRAGEAVLAYDPHDRLLSLDVWCDGSRVFGVDDLL